MAKDWSAQQKEIFSHVENSPNSLTVIARAGTGKTTTIVEALNYIPREKTVLLAAFNNSIAKELGERVNKSNVTVKTLHGFGLSTLAKLGRMSVDKDDNQLNGWVEDAIQRNYPKARIFTKVKKLVAFAKNTYQIKKEELALLADQLELSSKDEEVEQIVRIADIIFDEYDAKGTNIRIINFDDMVFLPMFLDLNPPKFDVVMVDERQDMNLPQNWLAAKAVKAGGKLIVVGDDRQAIYGFRGADASAMKNIGDTLTLDVTFRCAKKIVQTVNEFIPEISFFAHESNPEGAVNSVKYEQMIKSSACGDYIISRYNAPILKVCVELLAKGKPAKIAGKDVLARVEQLFDRALGIDKHNDNLSGQALIEICAKYTNQKISELQSSTKEDEALDRKIQLLLDDQACIEVLAEAYGSLREIRNKLAMLSDERVNPKAITCMTAHKAKGLETDQIWVLSNFTTKNTEETNCWYVALTRGKKVLNLVGRE